MRDVARRCGEYSVEGSMGNLSGSIRGTAPITSFFLNVTPGPERAHRSYIHSWYSRNREYIQRLKGRNIFLLPINALSVVLIARLVSNIGEENVAIYPVGFQTPYNWLPKDLVKFAGARRLTGRVRKQLENRSIVDEIYPHPDQEFETKVVERGS